MPRLMEIATPLGADTLLFHGMHAREELGRVSEFQVDLLSAKGDIALDDILGKNVTVKVMTAKDQTRYFNGYVTWPSCGSGTRATAARPTAASSRTRRCRTS
jgi:type VI secretion system secreted protein VgrG